jgi:UDP-glucose 4-epimerase
MINTKRKVLILGGGGFIGSEIVRILVNRGGYEITVGDNFCTGKKDEEFNKLILDNNIRLLKEDFTDPLKFSLLDNFYDDFYMLASMIGVNNTLQNPHEVIRVNTALIFNSLEWIKKIKVTNVLFTSTSECYSGTIDRFGYKVPTPEEIPLCIDPIDHPRFTYAVTKMLGESGFLNYSKVFGFNCKIIRYNNIIGPQMGFGHVIPHLVERFLNNENPFKVYGGDQTRSFCDISDGALGTILAMESNLANHDIFHIGSEIEITIDDLVKEAGKYMGYTGEYELAPTYPGSVSRRCPDITKAKTVLGFQPKISWQKALHKSIDWYINYFTDISNKNKNHFLSPEQIEKK